MSTATDQGAPPVSRTPSPRPAPPGRLESISGLLAGTKRKIVPIRKTFCQQGHGRTTTGGPIAQFLTSHDNRGLEAYLLVHALASASMPHDVTVPSGVWVRALGLLEGAVDARPTEASARSAVSKVMRRLEERKLIERGRRNRTAVISLLREDGHGQKFERPLGHERDDRWFQLPHAYWLDGHYAELSLPAKVMLLIALTRPDRFRLPEEKAPRWYGISPDSAGAGLRELVNANLLMREFEWIRADRSDTGWTELSLFTPIAAFSAAARKEAAHSRGGAVPEVPDLDLIQEGP